MGEYYSKTEEGWICEYCGFSSETRGEMLRHHNPENPEACPVRFGEGEGEGTRTPKEEGKEEAFYRYHAETMEEINEFLSGVLRENEEDEEIRAVLEHSLKGGKRFRPTLTMLVCDSLGGDRERALVNAAIVELIHSGTLVHDDVIDGDDERRGLPSIHRLLPDVPGFPLIPEEFDPKSIATLTGDNLLSIGLWLARFNPEVVTAASDAIRAVTRGATKEAKNLLKIVTRRGINGYEEVSRLKTGGLFAFATHTGALASDCDPDREEAARRYGVTFGVAYQLADDLAENEVPEGLDREQVMNRLNQHIRECRVLVSRFPDNQYTEMLKNVPSIMVRRMFQQENRQDLITEMQIKEIEEL